MKQLPRTPTLRLLLRSAALTRLSRPNLGDVPDFSGLFKAKTGERWSGGREGHERQLNSLLSAPSPFLFVHQSAFIFLRWSHCSCSGRGWGEWAWVSSVNAPLFLICSLIPGWAPTRTVAVQSLADISIYKAGGQEWWGICVCASGRGVFKTPFFLRLNRKKKKPHCFLFHLIHWGFFKAASKYSHELSRWVV